MFGPTESKIGSKQDPAKAYIEVQVKNLTSMENESYVQSNEELKHELKNVMEQVIKLSAYPKSIFSFQIFVVKDETRGIQLFSICFNALVMSLNQAGIALNIAPVAALTFGVRESKDSIDLIPDVAEISEGL